MKKPDRKPVAIQSQRGNQRFDEDNAFAAISEALRLVQKRRAESDAKARRCIAQIARARDPFATFGAELGPFFAGYSARLLHATCTLRPEIQAELLAERDFRLAIEHSLRIIELWRDQNFRKRSHK